MTGRITPLGQSLLAVVGAALALGVLCGRPELFVAAVPLLLALASLALRAPRLDHTVVVEVEPARIFEGDTVEVTVTVQARAPLALVELRGPRPAGSAVVAGRARAAMTVREGDSARWSYALRFAGRGVHDLGTVDLRVRDRLGLYAWEYRHAEPRPVRVYPRVTPLRTLPRPAHARASSGDYVSAALGEGIEPADIREFAPGDRVKQVNWRASLRLGRLYVTQHHRERNADVVLMLDTLAEVGRAPSTTLDWSVRAAASLATAYLARKDRVGLVLYGGLIHWVKPAAGRAQYERLADALSRASVVFTYVAKDLAVVPPRVLPARAVVVCVTPLLDARFSRAAQDLAARGFDVVVLVVCPVQVTRQTVRPSPVVDLACRLWRLERRARFAELYRQGIAVAEWRPSEPLELALAGMRQRPRRIPA